MNKFLRYLIFVLLLAGVAYAVYHFMNKPVAKVEEVKTVVADATDPVVEPSPENPAVTEDTTSTPDAENPAVTDGTTTTPDAGTDDKGSQD